ncbi:MAG: hypothetical protein ACOH5I_08295 [Oligoflexus sp.]
MKNWLFLAIFFAFIGASSYVYHLNQTHQELTVQDIQGYWDLSEVLCHDSSSQTAINTKIQQGDFQMRLTVNANEVTESVLEKSSTQTSFAGFRLKSTLELGQGSARLWRESLEILNHHKTIVHQWDKTDPARQKPLKVDIDTDQLKITSDEICGGGTGIFLAVQAGSKAA